MSYIDRFMRLRCAGDVLESIQPIKADIGAQISEAMAIIEAIRPLTLKKPGEFTVIDFCPNAPLAGVIAAHLLPVEHVQACAWRPRDLKGISRVQRLTYKQAFAWDSPELIGKNRILVAIRPNYSVAQKVAAIAGENLLPMAMIPANIGRVGIAEDVFDKLTLKPSTARLPAYYEWLDYLSWLAKGDWRWLNKRLPGANDGIVMANLYRAKFF